MYLYLKDALNLFQCIPAYFVLQQWIFVCLFDDNILPVFLRAIRWRWLRLLLVLCGFNLVASVLWAYNYVVS